MHFLRQYLTVVEAFSTLCCVSAVLTYRGGGLRPVTRLAYDLCRCVWHAVYRHALFFYAIKDKDLLFLMTDGWVQVLCVACPVLSLVGSWLALRRSSGTGLGREASGEQSKVNVVQKDPEPIKQSAPVASLSDNIQA